MIFNVLITLFGFPIEVMIMLWMINKLTLRDEEKSESHTPSEKSYL